MRNVEHCDRCGKFTMVGIDNGSALLFAHQFCKCSDERESTMSDNARDTQFQNFAKLLLDNLGDEGFVFEGADDNDREEELTYIRDIIARRAYDLVEHSVGYSLEYLDECGKEISGGMGKRIMPSIPDMTELPKE